MTFEELLKVKENIRFKIKSNTLKIKELKNTYFPNKGNLEGIGQKNNTSPQEIIILRIDALEQRVQRLEQEEIEVDEQLEKKLELIDNPRDRWIVYQKINGIAYAEIKKTEGYSYSHIRKIYEDALRTIRGIEECGG